MSEREAPRDGRRDEQAPGAGAAPAAGGMLRAAVLPTLGVGAVLVAGSAVLAGGRGALGAAVGTALVVAFFGVDFAGLRWASARFPDAPMQLAVLGYVLKVVGLGVLLAVFRGTPAIAPVPFAVSTFACAAVWLAAHITLVARLGAAPRPGSAP